MIRTASNCRLEPPTPEPLLTAFDILITHLDDASDIKNLWKNLRMDADSKVCGLDPDSHYVELAVEVFSMLADATRVRIIMALRTAEELSVNHLADIVDKTPAAVSQHLAKLRLARMVTTRQVGTRIFYRLADEHGADLVKDAIRQAEHSVSNGSMPRHHHTGAGASA